MTCRNAIRSVLAFAAALLLSATANAQLFRAYLAPTGSDANPCTLPAPCRLLPAALAAVADGGEIWMLDSANYNTATVTISKSVSILAVPGAVGSVLAVGGPAINIATASVKVALRNLVITQLPGGGGTIGINMTNGSSLVVENCLITNLPNSGILVLTAAVVRITDSIVRNNGISGVAFQFGPNVTIARTVIGGNAEGISIFTNTGQTTTADIIDSTVDGNSGLGIHAYSAYSTGVIRVSVTGSGIFRGSSGIQAEAVAGASVTVSASGNTISGGGFGIVAYGAGTRIWAAGNTITGTGTAFLNNSSLATFESAGNNALRNNGSDVSGTVTVPAPALR